MTTHCLSAHCIGGSLKHENGCSCYCAVCLPPRKPYTAPKLRKLDSRCVVKGLLRLEEPPLGFQHVPDCKCEK